MVVSCHFYTLARKRRFRAEQQEQLFLQKNLGFIKLALRHGIPIVPSYAFGEGQLFKTYPHVLRALREWIALKLRIGLPAIWPCTARPS